MRKCRRSLRGDVDKEFDLLYGPGLGLAHGELEIAVLQMLSGPGQVPQFGDEEPGQGLVIPRGQLQVQGFVQGLDFGAGADQVVALPQFLERARPPGQIRR